MKKLADWWSDFFRSDLDQETWWERKQALCLERDVEISRIKGNGHVFQELRYDNNSIFQYLLHVSFLMKQKNQFYVEEQVIPYQFRLRNGEIIEHSRVEQPRSIKGDKDESLSSEFRNVREHRFSYDRLAAVKYAERWWNSYNPAYRKFDVDCTNYISQCLYAGGAPMRGAPNRGNGWWYQGGNWSFSWAVAHSLRWYLSGSTQGLKGKEMQSASELIPGDVICYDFEGDGRWNHNTIVVAKDAYGMPLVNAHTSNSRNRYWSYEDSTAYTPNIKYMFFRIGE